MIKILNTPPSQRTQGSIKILIQQTESLSIFNQMTEERDEQMFKECCTVLRYKFIPKGFVVFNSGDKGDFFYLILDGQVSISMKNENEELESVCFLGPGGTFGELALIKDQPRLATIHCIKDTHFATLCKSDYLRVLGHLSTKKLEQMISFFVSLPTFAGWSKRSLIKLSYYFRSVRFKRNQVVFHETDPAESVFIVKKGEVEISKQINVKRPSLRKFGNDGRVLPVLKKGDFHMNAKVSIEGIGEIIGDDDIMKDLPRSFTCTCYSTTAELLEISKNDFKKRIRAEESLAQLSSRLQVKESHVNSALSMFKKIKKPVALQEFTDHGAGKEYLKKIKEKNPWNSAQKEFSKKRDSSTSQIMKKAIQTVAACRSLPLSPKSITSSTYPGSISSPRSLI
jgi:CRP-like cAMP-binding protein